MNLIQTSINRPKFITMVTLFLIVMGALALSRLPVDLYPNVSYPVLVVRSRLPGAAPSEVEQLITKKMEDVLSTLAGLETLRSVSREGVAIVIMEFASDTDVRFQEIQVRGKIANLRDQLPDAMKEPEIFRQDPDDTPIMEIAVVGQRPASELTRLAEDIVAFQLRQINGVGQVDVVGGRSPEIAVNLKSEALLQHGLNASDIVAAIRSSNRSDPLGKIQGDQRTWLLRSLSQASAVGDLERIAVKSPKPGSGRGPILVSDLGSVVQGFEEPTRRVQFGDPSGHRPTVLLNVLKQSGSNTVAVSDRVRTALERMGGFLPADVHVITTRDNADLVRSNVADVYESLILGGILTVVVVLLFLRSLRSTITTAISLPSSVITTFGVMALCGFTVNVMTLLALSLAVGLLVDDAIVVRENIVRHLTHGDPKGAAVRGAKEVQLAVVATTLTIVAVFFPVGFMGGVSGQFFRQFALTVVIAVMISLWDAMTMAPMLSAYFAHHPDPSVEWRSMGRWAVGVDRLLLRFEHFFDWVAAGYGRLLHRLLDRPLLVGVIGVAAIATAVGGILMVKKSFIPTQFGSVFSVSLQGPLAMPQKRVEETADLVEERLVKVPGLANWTISAGTGFSGAASVDLTVRVHETAGKNQKMLADVRGAVRQALQGIPGFTVRVSEPADPLAGSSGRFQPLAVVVAGDDIERLKVIGLKVREIMASIPGIIDISPLQDDGLPEIQIKTDPLLASYLGVSPQDVSSNLNTWITGDVSNAIVLGNRETPIRVRLTDGDRMAPQKLLALRIFPKGQGVARDSGVALASVTTTEIGMGAPTIVRENRQRIMRIGAGIAPHAALGNLVKDLEAKLAETPLPEAYSARIAGQNEQMTELFTNVLVALGLGGLFVYMVLVSLFESFIHPISVMLAIPLAATGAVGALLAFDMPLDLYGGVGMILLAGIVAKNSILLVDFAMQRFQQDGVSAREAILEAAPLRLRPIVMTSVAMIAGMLPVALGIGASGAARKSLGVATIGGVISSTVLSLLVVPSLFVMLAQLTRRWGRKSGG